MQEFQIRLRSVKDVHDFVALATTQPYPITVRDSHNQINGKSFMEMFCLDFTGPLNVHADCSETEASTFRQDALRFRQD